MHKPGLITLEFLTIIVRLHNKPTSWGEFAPYENGFVLHQVEPNVYEAKLANSLDFDPSHQRELKQRLVDEIGAEKVFLKRHKPGKAPYRIVITKDGIHRETMEKAAP